MTSQITSKINSFKGLFETLCNFGDKIAFEFPVDNNYGEMTFAQFGKMSEKYAHFFFSNFGANNVGRYVGIALDTCVEYPSIVFGLMMAGYKTILLDQNSHSELIIHLLHEVNAVGVVTDRTDIQDYSIRKIYRKDIVPSVKVPDGWRQVWEDEIAFCTSGTTDTSKVFAYNGKQIASNITNILCAVEEAGDSIVLIDGSKVIAFLPMFHIFGFICMFIWYLINGMTLVFIKDRNPKTIVDICQKRGITHFQTIPLLLNNLANKIESKINELPGLQKIFIRILMNVSLIAQTFFPKIARKIAMKVVFKKFHENLLGTNLIAIFSGGAHLQESTARLLSSIGFYISCGFGLTETGIVSYETGHNLKKRLTNSLGKFFKDVEVKFDTSNTNYKGKNGGELFLRANFMHVKRIKGGIELKSDFDNNGWYSTGDVGQVKSSGEFYFLGRLKDTIIGPSGENIYPDEIESYFKKLENEYDIETVVVLGYREHNIEKVTLMLFVKKYYSVENNVHIVNKVIGINNTLTFNKRITKLLLCRDDVPVTTTRKVRRQFIRRLLENKEWPTEEIKLVAQNVTKNTKEIKATDKDAKLIFEIKEIVSKVINIPVNEISEHENFQATYGVDSLGMLQIVGAIEEKYGIEFDDQTILQLNCLKAVAHAINEELESVSIKKNIVKNFEDSIEYKGFQKRIAGFDPHKTYFVPHDSLIKDTSIVNGKRVINFGSYNYLGLSGNPLTVKAAQEAAAKYGTSASGSRLIAGEKPLYQELEAEIAKWKNTDDALVLVSGHATNVTFVGNFCGENDLILYDALAHNSVQQGCQLSKAKSRAFPHNDYQFLEKFIKRSRMRYEKVLIVIEGVYSMDGDIAPVPEFVKIAKENSCFLMVDEAHSSCVIGKTGRGVDEHFNLKKGDIDILMGTLSKGIGSCGGYLAGNRNLIDYLRFNVPGFVFSVGISPTNAAAALQALKMIQNDSIYIEKLHKNIRYFTEKARERSFDICLAGETAIIPVFIGKDENSYMLSQILLEKGIFVPPAVYPAVPVNKSRLRFCVNSDHTEDQIDRAMEALSESMAEMVDFGKKEKVKQ
jgi:8-amino-7-oxononanoate synthase/acyl carrier protein